MKKSSFFSWMSCALFLISNAVLAQFGSASFDASAELNRAVSGPSTPEAAAFGQYGNTPVNLYYGTPNIQVPIYNHKGRELDLPISLSYDATGIKVEQQATNVGLGWNLNVGGMVSRVVNGFPDDYDESQTSQGYRTIWDPTVRSQINTYSNNNTTFSTEAKAWEYLQFLTDLNTNAIDTQPDYFSFNALGYSETFVLNVTGIGPQMEARPLNNPRMKAAYTRMPTGGLYRSIATWEITADDGTIFTFEEHENTRTNNTADNPSGQNSSLYGLVKDYFSSWYLTKIESAHSKDVYEFEYNSAQFSSPIPGGASVIERVSNVVGTTNPFPTPGQSVAYQTVNTFIKHKMLSRIKHNGEVIIDVSVGTRHDILINNKVEEIQIYSNYVNSSNNDLYKAFSFNYDYFKTDENLQPGVTGTTADFRLKLDGITIKDKVNTSVSSYEFEYIQPNDIPRIRSKAQDYYGYYNGKNNTELYPRNDTYPETNDGGDRSVVFNKAKIGTLNKITYPTGGHTIFEYGPNRSNYVTPSQTTTTQTYQSKVSIGLQGGVVCYDENTGITDWDCPDSECSTNGCIDTYLQVNGPPKVKHEVFAIDDFGPYLMNVSLSGTTLNNFGKDIILIKRSDDVNQCNGPFGLASLTYDQIIDQGGNYGGILPGVDVVYRNTTAGPDFNNQNVQIVLGPGCYQITLVNPEEGSSTSFNLGRYVSNTTTTGGTSEVVDKAGIRVNMINDYTEDGVLAVQKKFSYSIGEVIKQPLYQYLKTEKRYTGNGQETEDAQILYRQSYVPGLDGPHIGYPQVSVKTITQDSLNTDVKVHKFNTENFGSHFTGVYNFYDEGKPTANNYAVRYKLGKPKEVLSRGKLLGGSPGDPFVPWGTKYIEQTEYTHQEFYKSVGLYPAIKEDRGDTYPVPIPSPNGGYIIDPQSPTPNGTIFGGIRYTPPPGCLGNANCNQENGRTELKLALAYGYAGFMTQSTRIEKDTQLVFTGEETLEQTTVYTYYDGSEAGEPDNFLLKKTETTDSRGEKEFSEYYYPENYPSEYGGLINDNMLTVPVETKVYKGQAPNQNLLTTQKTNYIGTYPSTIEVSKAEDPPEIRVSFDEYRNGNLVQTSLPGGASTAYLWGYDQRYVIAKIENATYSDIENLFGTGFTIPNGLTASQESQLRALPNTMVTTYVYDPMVGLISMTDPRGYTSHYEYDNYHRLKRVRDAQNNVIQRNDYNYGNN